MHRQSLAATAATKRFRDRADAGRALAGALQRYLGRPDTIVLGLPRGGVPVAGEVARALGLALDVLVVRKIGVPFQPELAMGAVASGGAVSVNHDVIRMTGVTAAQFERVRAREEAELHRREQVFRGNRPHPAVHGRTVIVVDDGLATGASMRAALMALRQLGAARLVVAVPVAPPDAAQRFAGACDEFVCVASPPGFAAVGQFYEQFGQTSDAEVRALLDRAIAAPAEAGTRRHP